MPRISKATEYNWKKLNSDSKEKLTKRANKTLSRKRVIATSYLDYAPAISLLNTILEMKASVEDIMYSLCVDSLRFFNINDKPNVKDFMSKYDGHELLHIEIPDELWTKERDVLGFIYQSLT